MLLADACVSLFSNVSLGVVYGRSQALEIETSGPVVSRFFDDGFSGGWNYLSSDSWHLVEVLRSSSFRVERIFPRLSAIALHRAKIRFHCANIARVNFSVAPSY